MTAMLPATAMTLNDAGQPCHTSATIVVVGPAGGRPGYVGVVFMMHGALGGTYWQMPRAVLARGVDLPAEDGPVFVCPAPTETDRFVEIVLGGDGPPVAFRVARQRLRAALELDVPATPPGGGRPRRGSAG